MSKKYDVAIYIGRFQPLHLGHLHVLDHCKSIADKALVLVGSCCRPRSTKNPFSYFERKTMLDQVAASIDLSLETAPLRDFLYRDDLWVESVKDTVRRVIGDKKVALVGHNKDESSWYLSAFPEWPYEEVSSFERVNAMDIRESILSSDLPFSELVKMSPVGHRLPTSVKTFLCSEGRADRIFGPLREEHRFIQSYKDSWKNAPYPPTLVTADAVIESEGHILLIRRGRIPGKGLWALPGGFVDKDETLLESAIREAYEETCLDLNPEVLKRSLVGQKVFDAPSRGSRGRTITTAFHFRLEGPLPDVAAADDAGEAIWTPIADISRAELFEDHFDILFEFLNPFLPSLV